MTFVIFKGNGGTIGDAAVDPRRVMAVEESENVPPVATIYLGAEESGSCIGLTVVGTVSEVVHRLLVAEVLS